MPPKKKKSTPIVVGTVSTRSTRRESIVNIEIIPKANKLLKSPIQKKTLKESPKTPDKHTNQDNLDKVSDKTSHEILEILKDWSDDNSQDECMFSLSSAKNSKMGNDGTSNSLPVDQQSLIDILEGNMTTQSKELQGYNQQVARKLTHHSIEIPIINVNSPQTEESVIEECVVEDDSFIIEMPEEQIEIVVQDFNPEQDKESSVIEEDTSCVDDKLRNPLDAPLSNKCNLENDIDMTSENINNKEKSNPDEKMYDIDDKNAITKYSGHISHKDLKNTSLCPTDGESRSGESENTATNSKIVEQYVPDTIMGEETSVDNSESKENMECSPKHPGDKLVLSTDNPSEISKANNEKETSVKNESRIELMDGVYEISERNEFINISNKFEYTLKFSEEKNNYSNNEDISEKLFFSSDNQKENSENHPPKNSCVSDQNKKISQTSLKIEEITKIDACEEERNFCQKINESIHISKGKDFVAQSDELNEDLEKMQIDKELNETKLLPFQSELVDETTKKQCSSNEKCEIEKITLVSKEKEELITTEIEAKQIRRSSRRKSTKENASLEISTLQEESGSAYTSEKEIETNSSCDQSLDMKYELANTADEIPKEYVKSPKNSKKLSKKTPEIVSENSKLDMDLEETEHKMVELEIEETSNDSNLDSNYHKVSRTKTKRMSMKDNNELEKMDVESNIENSQIENSIAEMDPKIFKNEFVQSKRSKENKTKTKKATKKGSEEESCGIDSTTDISQNIMDVSIIHSDIDATIDEVLRKYTQVDSDNPNESLSPRDIKSKVTKQSKESKKKKELKSKRDDKYENSEEVRRSDRIKTIPPPKKKSHGLVKSKSDPSLADYESLESGVLFNESDMSAPVTPQLQKKSRAKSKSKSKSSEHLESINTNTVVENSPQLPKSVDLKTDESGKAEIEGRLRSFVHLKENQYKTDRQICKEAREMVCDCFLAEEDIQKDEYGCGEDCLNRLLMIECGELCQVGERCTNKKFQRGQTAPVEVFKTEKKGLGLIAAANIPYGEFILEYIGEVLDPEEFDNRAEVYSKDKNIHFYFMSLRSDAIIDATMKGNISRFINHSCDPNAETQKWTVNGELRIGFFSTRTILAGEEITFDYKFQRYGKEAQKCYCGATICRGWLGERPDESEDEEDEDDEDEEEERVPKVEQVSEVDIKGFPPDVHGVEKIDKGHLDTELNNKIINVGNTSQTTAEVNKEVEKNLIQPEIKETPKKLTKKKPRKELLYEDFDQLNEDIEMVVTTGLKNQAHTLKLSRLMVRAKDLEQRKKLLRVLRRGELPCRRLFLDYHGLRLMHGYMIDAQQLTIADKKLTSRIDFLQTKLELLQTLAVLPIQNKTMLIESKVLPAVEKWSNNEDLIEDNLDQNDKKTEVENPDEILDPSINEKIEEIKFLASKLLEEWANLKESFRIPKKQRIEQMKEHEKEANRKFVESSYGQEKESSRKNDQRYRTWSRYKSEREINKKGPRLEDKDRPSAEFLKISKHERRKLFALQMELKEEERRLKQREMWRQHEMNCMMIGADPRFTAPFDPNKGFQYIWNPSIGQWQALPVPSNPSHQGVYHSPVTSQGVTSYNVPPTHKASLLRPYTPTLLNVSGLPPSSQQFKGMPANIPPMVPGISPSVPTITNQVPGISAPLAGMIPGMTSALHGISTTPIISGPVPGTTQPPLPSMPLYPEAKHEEEDPSQVKFAGPIPPPVKLPPKWKCVKDKYGRPYYYHVKIRKSQWEPPPLPEDESTESSSSETSSLSSSESSSDSDTDDEIDDTKLLMEVRKQMESGTKFPLKSVIPAYLKKEEKDSATPSPEVKLDSDTEMESAENMKDKLGTDKPDNISSIDIRLKEQFNLDGNDLPKKKRRIGLCQEIIISPRTEEDRKQFKEDVKRYKATKEKLKRQKEQMAIQTKKLKIGTSPDDKRLKEKRVPKSNAKSRMKRLNEWNDEHAKKIKEVFRSTMATTVVGVLNAYRKPDCKESRITNTEDFKHLARKLTHFVMLKEMKHINTIEELICTDNVKAKAREYIKKYMSKFGEVYQKRQDEPDFKD